MPARTPRPRLKTRRELLFESSPEDTPARRRAGKRQLRKGLILGHLRREGARSRVEIARALGFNLRSVSLLVDELAADHLVVEQEGRRTSIGRRPVPVALNAGAACVVGIDVGRSSTTASVLDLEGSELRRLTRPSPGCSDPVGQTTWILALLKELIPARACNLPPVAGIGLASEGLAHQHKHPAGSTAAVEAVRARLEAALKLPVHAGTDSQLLAVGESWFGAARGSRHAAIFNLTDGLGFACLADGKLLTGGRGWAGQIGHLPLGEPEIPCFCGSSSCLENVASGSALVRMAKHAGLLGKQAPEPETVFKLAAAGSASALAIVTRFADALALGMAVAIDLYDPEVVVLGGQLSRYAEQFEHALFERARQLAVPFLSTGLQIRVSTLHEDAILLGACATVLNQIYDTSHLTVERVL